MAELWLFDTNTEEWRLLTQSGSSTHDPPLPVEGITHPPGVMYATLTFVGDQWLYLFGGSLPHGEFSNQMYRIDVSATAIRWEKVN